MYTIFANCLRNVLERDCLAFVYMRPRGPSTVFSYPCAPQILQLTDCPQPRLQSDLAHTVEVCGRRPTTQRGQVLITREINAR
jgi:hypothetical protein